MAAHFALLVDLGNDRSIKDGPICIRFSEYFQGKDLGGWVGQKRVSERI